MQAPAPVMSETMAPPPTNEAAGTRGTGSGKDDRFTSHLRDARKHQEQIGQNDTGTIHAAPENRDVPAQTGNAEIHNQTEDNPGTDPAQNPANHQSQAVLPAMAELVPAMTTMTMPAAGTGATMTTRETGSSVPGSPVSAQLLPAGSGNPLVEQLATLIDTEAGEMVDPEPVAPAADPGNIASVPDGGAAPVQGNARGEITIDHWSATFSVDFEISNTGQGNRTGTPAVIQSPEDEANPQTQPVISGLRQPDLDQIAMSDNTRVQTDFAGQRQDSNTSYIQSQLPAAEIQTAIGESDNNRSGNSEQQDNGNLFKEQQNTTGAQGRAGDSPLIFSLEQTMGTQSPATAASGTTAGSSIHLSNGVDIPAAHVLDQVATHFNGQRHLETGTVTLRLYPEELGELRMEIKVEQDNIKAHIIAQNPQVQELLEHHLPRLRQAMTQQGLNLEQMQITLAADDRASQFSRESGSQEHSRQTADQGRSDQPVFSLNEENQEKRHNPDNLRVVA